MMVKTPQYFSGKSGKMVRLLVGTLKRSFIGHEAAVNCLVLNEGKLYTGSSDGTLRWVRSGPLRMKYV